MSMTDNKSFWKYFIKFHLFQMLDCPPNSSRKKMYPFQQLTLPFTKFNQYKTRQMTFQKDENKNLF